MNYYYDVLLNFLNTNTLFYEWDNLDNIEYYKKIPLISVDSTTLKEFINNEIKVNKEFLDTIEGKAKKKNKCSKYIAIFADRNGSIALEFDDEGNSISRSFLEIQDDINIGEIMYSINQTDINYKLVNKIDFNSNLRDEETIKRILITEIKNLEKNKEYLKLKYLYMELFDKEEEDINNIVTIMSNKINNEIGKEERKLYDLIKLSYNKV